MRKTWCATAGWTLALTSGWAVTCAFAETQTPTPAPSATNGHEAGAPCCAPADAVAPRVASEVEVPRASDASTDGMVWVPGGEFTMGGDDGFAQPHEKPLHRVRVAGFWMDATEVTNAQFSAFVEDTGYVTVAERQVDWELIKQQLPPGTPRPPDHMLQPASLVFSPPPYEVDFSDYRVWWKLVPGASWRAPRGPGTNIQGLDDHPVVQVCWEDAAAYAAWAGKQLPTEAQWEFAARGGHDDHTTNVWGDDAIDPTRANYWTGKFPRKNTAEDGFVYTNPVRAFPPNALGLYGMAGNVWEWCADLYRVDAYAQRVRAAPRDGDETPVFVEPTGPSHSFDPRNPYAPELRSQRGGSFLCNDDYCANYRPSSRESASPDSAMNHLGFRTVLIAPGPKE